MHRHRTGEPLLRILEVLASTYVVVLAVDALLALLDGLLGLAFGGLPLAPVHGTVSVLLLLGWPWLWLAWAATPRIPTSVALPPLVVVAWVLLGAMPLPVLFDRPTTSVLTSVAEALVAGWALWRIQALSGRPTLLDRPVDGPVWSPRHTGLVVLASLLVGPLAVGGYTFWSVDYALRHYTGDYAGLTSRGLELAHRVYTRDDTELHLIGMVHIGEKDAYDDVLAGIPVEGTVVLEEGVRDRTGLLDEGISYGGAATALGLSQQKPVEEDLGYRLRNADVDISTFSPETLDLLHRVFALFGAHDNAERLAAVTAYYQAVAPDPEGLLEGLFDDILHARNRHLHEVIVEEAARTPRVVVPWGAMHMAEVSELVEADGFVERETTWRVFIRFETVWRALAGG